MEMIFGAWRGARHRRGRRPQGRRRSGRRPAGRSTNWPAGLAPNPDALARLMRALVGEGIFVRRRDGRMRSMPSAETLRSDAPMSMAGMARWSGTWHTVSTGAVCSTPSGPVRPCYPNCAAWAAGSSWHEQPELAAIFNDAMTSMSEIGRRPGGGRLRLRAVPHRHRRRRRPRQAACGDRRGDARARGVLYDLPQVVEGAPELLQEIRCGGPDTDRRGRLLPRQRARRAATLTCSRTSSTTGPTPTP